MQLSVIILNYNVRYFLEACVLSVQKALSTIESEIIVVDNHSTDNSCDRMKERFPNIVLIENNQNLGFPKGNNIGVSRARGKYICILNPDTIVAEDTFEQLLAFVKTKQDLGIVGCKLIDGTGCFLPESKRGIPTPWVAFTKMMGLYKVFPRIRLFNQYYAQNVSENQTDKVAILVGAFMLMERKLYLEIGGFDENCFMYSDDIDLSYRVLKKNKNNYYYHNTTVIHFKGESTIRNEAYMKRFQEAMNFFYKKHFKTAILFSIVMKIGIFFFSFFKMFQGKRKKTVLPKKYVYLSHSIDSKKLIVQIQDKVTAPVMVAKDAVSEKRVEYIIDTNLWTYKKAIQFLEENKTKNCTFKILPHTANFMIGSNNKNDRGEIIVFDRVPKN